MRTKNLLSLPTVLLSFLFFSCKKSLTEEVNNQMSASLPSAKAISKEPARALFDIKDSAIVKKMFKTDPWHVNYLGIPTFNYSNKKVQTPYISSTKGRYWDESELEYGDTTPEVWEMGFPDYNDPTGGPTVDPAMLYSGYDPFLDIYFQIGHSWDASTYYPPYQQSDTYFWTQHYGGGGNPFGNFATAVEWSAPAFRSEGFTSKQFFTRRRVEMRINVVFQYAVQFNRNTSMYRFVYGGDPELKPFFSVSGEKTGEIDDTGLNGFTSTDRSGEVHFEAWGCKEKRTVIYDTQGKISFSTNVNLAAFQAGTVIEGEVRIQTAQHCYNNYSMYGNAHMATEGASDRPAHTVSWYGLSDGPQGE